MILPEKSAPSGQARGQAFWDHALLLSSEQPVEKPAVETAIDALRRSTGPRRYRNACRRDGGRERYPAGKSRQACNRHALMRAPHRAAPYFNRQPAAGRFLHRRGIVVAEPDAGHEVTRVTDEPRIPEVLTGSGLARG